jgi:hypothetical protein
LAGFHCQTRVTKTLHLRANAWLLEAEIPRHHDASATDIAVADRPVDTSLCTKILSSGDTAFNAQPKTDTRRVEVMPAC